MEQTLQIEREISDLKARESALFEQNKTIFSRLDKQDRMIGTINDLAMSVRDLTNAQTCMQGKVNDLCEDMEDIKTKPGRRWESVVDKLLMVAVGAIAGAVLAKIGL